MEIAVRVRDGGDEHEFVRGGHAWAAPHPQPEFREFADFHGQGKPVTIWGGRLVNGVVLSEDHMDAA